MWIWVNGTQVLGIDPWFLLALTLLIWMIHEILQERRARREAEQEERQDRDARDIET